MMHPNSACQWQIESPSPGKSMRTTLQQCTFFSKSHYIFCPSAHNGSNGPHLKHGKRQFYLSLHHHHQLVLSFLPSFQDLVYGNQKWSATFWECIVDHYSKHKLVGGRENLILRWWWNQTTKAMTTNVCTSYKVQGQ